MILSIIIIAGVDYVMLKVLEHLPIQERLTSIRRTGINGTHFRAGMIDIGRFMGYEFAKTLENEPIKVKTPLGLANGVKIKDKDDLVVISVLRAAIPLVEGIMMIFSQAKCGVIGAWRDDVPPFNVNINYIRIPSIEGKVVIVADPMLATGNTINAILDEICKYGTPKRLVLLNIIASEEGIKKIEDFHPDIEIYTCAIDGEVNSKGYIVPGLGDAGDICFGKPL
jgi:uracil phosphoribosyltransferase